MSQLIKFLEKRIVSMQYEETWSCGKSAHYGWRAASQAQLLSSRRFMDVAQRELRSSSQGQDEELCRGMGTIYSVH